jgi:hypothetical protein
MSMAAERLTRAIAAHAGPMANITSESVPWASATFAGARHLIRFDAARGAPLDAFRHHLHMIEFALAGGFIADIDLIERTVGSDCERLSLAVLTIDG